MTRRGSSAAQGDGSEQGPGAAIRPPDAARATPTSSRSPVTLPKAFAIDQRHLGNICSKAQLAAEHCAGRQPIGTAIDETPLLDSP